MPPPLKYHEGEVAIQKRAGAFEPADLEGNGLGTSFDPRAADFLGRQRWAVLAALDGHGRLWTSPIHGPAGFLQVEDGTTLAVHAFIPAGDPLVESFRHENEIGMLVLDAQNRRRMRINGRAQWTGQETLHVKAREVYGNCPKYIQRREIVGAGSGDRTEAVSASALSAGQREHVERADTFFIGSMHAEAGVDCSHRGGHPGFVRVIDERWLVFPDYSGNNMFQTLGNLSLNSRAGLLFLDFETGDTLHLTGTATIVWDAARLRGWPGAHRLVEMQVNQVVARERAFPLRWRLMDYSPFNPK